MLIVALALTGFWITMAFRRTNSPPQWKQTASWPVVVHFRCFSKRIYALCKKHWQKNRSWFVFIIIGFIFVTIALLLIYENIFLLREVASGPQSTTTTADARVSAAQAVLTAAGAIIAAVLTVWRLLYTNDANNIAKEDQLTALFNQATINLIAERETGMVVKEVESYSGKRKRTYQTKSFARNQEQRLAAVQALERIAVSSVREMWPIVQLLASYTVTRSKEWKNDRAAAKKDEKPVVTPQDLSAAFEIVQRLSNSMEGRETEQRLNLDNLFFFEDRLTDFSLYNASLVSSDFSGVKINRAKFRDVSLRDAIFERAITQPTSQGNPPLWFESCQINDANFISASLSGANFSGKCNLANSNFFMAKLRDADFGDSDVAGANFDYAFLAGADLSGVRNLGPVSLNEAYGDGTTKLPADFERPAKFTDSSHEDDTEIAWQTAVTQLLETLKETEPAG